jgi:hypothetical protein
MGTRLLRRAVKSDADKSVTVSRPKLAVNAEDVPLLPLPPDNPWALMSFGLTVLGFSHGSLIAGRFGFGRPAPSKPPNGPPA